MEHIIVFLQFIMLVTISYGEHVDIFRRFGNHREKRHAVVDQLTLCKTFGCLNGYCKEDELRKQRIVCECFTGYQGTLCDRLACPFSCGSHGTCAIKGHMLYCQCEAGYAGPRCESQVHPVHSFIPQSRIKPLRARGDGEVITVNQPSSWFAHTVTPKDIKFSDFHSHAVIDTNVKPDVCAPGFQCYHGECDRKLLMEGKFRCLCKKNYMGLFCEKKCTLDCKHGGQCFVMINGHQRCACPYGYQGYYCEKRIRE